MQEHTQSVSIDGKEYLFKTGKFAPRSESTVWAQVGETVVMTMVSVGQQDTDLDYFPLGVEYFEKMYAGGLISSSRFVKRETRPSDDAVLKARQIDHSIRSLFPKGFKKPVNVIVNVMSYDGENNPEVMAVASASLALMTSSIPFMGPSSSVVIGINKQGEFVVNPTHSQEEELESEFIVSTREDRILNIEGHGLEVTEEKMGQLMDLAIEKTKLLHQMQIEFTKAAGKPKKEFSETPAPAEVIADVEQKHKDQISQALYSRDTRNEEYAAVVTAYMQSAPEGTDKKDVAAAVDYIASKIMRAGILQEEKRTSGRSLDQVRELGVEVDILPRTHGSALFSRGKTQSLSIVTLGSTRLAQTIENFEGDGEKHFMHHYVAPGYSYGDAGRISYYPGRREVGHGNIGENALKVLMPSIEDFPYTVRVVSEIMSQMGSSSMAAATASSMALMAAGVPLKAAVAGISVGLVTNQDESSYKLLVDMEDVEDFYGDMDFKVTGTHKGITAIQLDNKLMGVPAPMLKEAMVKAKAARVAILEEIAKVIPAPRAELSKYAPRVSSVMIKQDQIGELIGPGGKNIKAMMEELGQGVDIDIQESGQVNVTALTQEQMEAALAMIKEMFAQPEPGVVYEAVVARIADFGVFVDVTKAIGGLVHVSEMADGYVSDPKALVKEGDTVKIKLLGMKEGKQSYTMKGLNPDIKAPERAVGKFIDRSGDNNRTAKN